MWNPLNWPSDIIKAIVGKGAAIVANALGGVSGMILRFLNQALFQLAQQVVGFVFATTRIDLSGGWWVTPRTTALIGTILQWSRWLMLAALLVGVVDWVASQHAGSALRSVTVGVAGAVLGIVMIADVVQMASASVDSVTTAVMGQGADNLAHFVVTGGGALSNAVTGGGLYFILGILFVFFTVVLLLELVTRYVLIFVCVMFSPLVFAGSVWPRMAGMRHKFFELLAALILSKFVIVAVLALGGSALADAGGLSAASVPTMLFGVVLMAVAACCPWLVYKVLPFAEAAALGVAVRTGVTSKTSRAAMTAANVSMSVAKAGVPGRAGGSASSATTPTPTASSSTGSGDGGGGWRPMVNPLGTASTPAPAGGDR